MTQPSPRKSKQGAPLLKTPDITTAQIVALVQAVIGTLVAFSVDITDAQSVAIIALVAVIGATLGLGDAQIRKGRALGSMER
jgi:hypothetical protein